MKRLFIFFTVLAITALACNMPGINASQGQTPQAISQLLVTPDPNATSTPTPFLPAAATATAQATQTQQPTETPTVQVIDGGEGVTKILLLGSDWRPSSGFRTDVIMLVSINRRTGATSVVSFPRDLYVTLPGYRQERINVAQALGGFELTQATYQYNFGFMPDYYVMTNFQGFKNIIDSLGGITVNASRELYDSCDLSWQDGSGKCSAGPGEVQMDGETALWYVRSRYSSSDFDRTRRAQEVIKATFVKMMSLNAISKIPDLYSALKSNVETNIPLDVIISLARFAPGLIANTDQIKQYAIGSQDVWAWMTAEGAQVLLPNPDRIQPILSEALNIE